LDALRRAGGRSCSGEALSALHGVTRAQVWKHVEAIRRHGYTVEATPGDGYRLTGIPDRLYPEEISAGLDTRWLARSLHYFDSTDSTNRVALGLARDSAEHGATVLAEGQTAGRGRLGRSFFSPPYLNLYTSIVLRPRLTTAEAPTWVLASATAVAETVGETVGDPEAVEIKWPNDVLLGGLKTSGILMELGAEATRVAFLVLGIGVNLNVEREALPGEFRDLATSLRGHLGRRVDRIRFAQRLYGNLERVLDTCAECGFDGVRPQFEARFRMRGRRVRVLEQDRGELSGVALGIDSDGALRVGRDDGREMRVVAGDVTLVKPGGQADARQPDGRRKEEA
jgi:BirA family biotin operon repressor/biotin-[acetyl-CoA-carboxylase] ligase